MPTTLLQYGFPKLSPAASSHNFQIHPSDPAHAKLASESPVKNPAKTQAKTSVNPSDILPINHHHHVSPIVAMMLPIRPKLPVFTNGWQKTVKDLTNPAASWLEIINCAHDKHTVKSLGNVLLLPDHKTDPSSNALSKLDPSSSIGISELATTILTPNTPNHLTSFSGPAIDQARSVTTTTAKYDIISQQ